MTSSDRRTVLRGIAGVGTLGLAGCTSVDRVRRDAASELSKLLDEGTTGDASGVTPEVAFAFERDGDRLRIRTTDGGVSATNLLVRSSSGAAVRWHQLGSTSVQADGVVTVDDSAAIGPDVANWPTALTEGETIRVVYVSESGRETPVASYEVESGGGDDGASRQFEEDFEDGSLDGWSVVWQNFGSAEPTNEWSVTDEHAIEGEYSLYLDADGDPNVLATDERVIRFDREFTLAVRYRVPGPENRGPGVRLLDVDRNGSRGDYVEPSTAVNVGTIRGADGAYADGEARFRMFGHEATLEPDAVSVGEAHESRVVRSGDTITGYHDGEAVLTVPVSAIEADPSIAYRLAFRNSGTWGDTSSIYYDDVRYATGTVDEEDATESSDGPARFSFEDAQVGAASPPDPWRMRGTAGEHEITSSHATAGERTFHMASYRDDLEPTEALLSVDLSAVSHILVDAYVEAKNAYQGDVKLWIDERGTDGIRRFDAADNPEPTAHRDVALDVSDFDGQHDVLLFVRGDGNDVYWDNIRFVDAAGDLLARSDVR